MAVSGRKNDDFQGSISICSTEDFDLRCEPCLAIGQEREARGFRVHCSEYLCKDCLDYHQRIDATKHYNLVNKDNMDKHTVTKETDECGDECTEKCPVHKKEVINSLCPEHESLGCNECIVLNHRACDINYIPDKCTGIGDSVEFREVMRKLEQNVNEVEDVKQLQSKLQDHKASKLNEQLYITMKQVKSKLKIDEIKEADGTLEKTNMQYIFEQNQDLTNVHSGQNAFGKLALSSPLETTKMEPTVTLTLKRNINIKTNSDQKECCITGCVVLSSNKLVVADFNNEKLKIVDMKYETVIEETTLSSEPWDIAVISQDQIAVTIPDKKEILIMTTADKLSTVRRFPVEGDCGGIAYHQGHLYIVSSDPKCVFITDTEGNLQKTITLDDKRFVSPNYLLLSQDLRQIFISDFETQSVVSLTLQGDISAVYKNKDFNHPGGMMMLDDGSFLVCCGLDICSIYLISGDLKQDYTIKDGLLSIQALCYNSDQQEVYVGCEHDLMMVFSAK